MKVVHLSTYDRYGGAAIAALRTHLALLGQGMDSAFLVQQQSAQDPGVQSLIERKRSEREGLVRFALERLCFLPFEKSKALRFAFSPARIGADVNTHPLVQSADVVHLHWVQFGFLSLRSLRRLTELQKPIVWTLYDMWPFTGGCHYSNGCLHYQTHCHNCPFLKSPHPKDLSYRVFEDKVRLLQDASIHFVACSGWLQETAQSSTLLQGFPVHRIATPIHTHTFKAISKAEARQKLGLDPDKKLILFGAMNTTDPRKGFAYLVQALEGLRATHPEITTETELAVFGKSNPEVLAGLPFQANNLGVLSSEAQLIAAYSAADVLVLPSLEDNLPNTVTEALACSLPVVGFRSGGVPEMIDHLRNGWLANPRSADDLGAGIYQVLYRADARAYAASARQKAESTFSEATAAESYSKLYAALLEKQAII